MALVAQHAFDSAIGLARGDNPRVALAAAEKPDRARDLEAPVAELCVEAE
jgi:hypothetical protein